jgi:multidrug efflux pump
VNISGFFITRPRFAMVLSLVIFIAGLVAIPGLPIGEYPQVVPPTVVVRTSFPGADPTVIAETVATPLEQAINGVEGMLYQSSQATADGSFTLTVTFALATDGDKDQVLVQNRVQAVLARLPQEVQRFGVTTTKASPTLVEVVHITSTDDRHDALYLSSYAELHIKDQVTRLYGVGDLTMLGEGAYAMRVWLNPDALASRSLTASDVVRALQEQNLEVAAGQLGAEPTPAQTRSQVLITALGRLETAEQFGNIIVKAGEEGQIVHLRDVARVELGSNNYALQATLDNRPAISLAIFQRPGTNALKMADGVKETMERLSKDFPPGVQYHIVYDTTGFVRESIHAVIHTLFEAVLLVVLVVVLFLQSWRASVIPLIAVPVSLVGTFAVLAALGFGLNALTLFGLVLAIGIVVDDAIVVVENVERNIEEGLESRAATVKAMGEVTGPIISTALVLCAVFVPTAFLSGLTGQFYRQFALTIAISTVISAFNSLTLSPALAAVMLKSPHTPRDAVERAIDRSLGWLFRPFNRFFHRLSHSYVRVVSHLIGRSAATLAVYAVLIALCVVLFVRTPGGFVPQQDKMYLVGIVQLPDAATLTRTEKVVHEIGEMALATPGVAHAVQFSGVSINGLSRSQNSGVVFFPLKPFDERHGKSQSAAGITAALMKKFSTITDAQISVFPPPPVQGLGTIGGFQVQIEDQAGLGFAAVNDALRRSLADSRKDPRLRGLFSTFEIGVPKINANMDREKAKSQGVAVSDLFDTLQIYLGSLYVNDFNRFGRTYQVFAQADQQFRLQASDMGRLQVRNASGQMIPVGAFIHPEEATGPDRVSHYNSLLTAEMNGTPGDGYSSGQAQTALEQLLKRDLPNGLGFEWTDLTYQQIIAGNTAQFVFPLCVLLAYLVLVAQYESWSLPLVVILIVPMCLLCALTGVQLTHGDNNVFTQIGLIVLVGLACKNAILIVEFARDRELKGAKISVALIEACRLRLRPILMTSMAFIMGVAPLALSTGAGSEMRRAIGIAVFFGMLGVTMFGLALTPVFYWVVRSLALKCGTITFQPKTPPPPRQELAQ